MTCFIHYIPQQSPIIIRCVAKCRSEYSRKLQNQEWDMIQFDAFTSEQFEIPQCTSHSMMNVNAFRPSNSIFSVGKFGIYKLDMITEVAIRKAKTERHTCGNKGEMLTPGIENRLCEIRFSYWKRRTIQ